MRITAGKLLTAATIASALISSCADRYELTVTPANAILGTIEGKIDSKRIGPGRYLIEASGRNRRISLAAAGHESAAMELPRTMPFERRTLSADLVPILHRLRIDTIEGLSDIAVDGIDQERTSIDLKLPEGQHRLTLSRDGFADHVLDIQLKGDLNGTLRHQKNAGAWRCVAVYRTGRQPKQVAFTPDGRKLVITLLNDSGFNLIDLREGGQTKLIEGVQARKKGYVEPLICPERGSFWVSQMTTDTVFEYSLPTAAKPEPELLRTLPSAGVWPKVIARDEKYRFLAVSNWVSSTVAIFDYGTGGRIAMLSRLDTPRGLVFSKDGGTLFVCSYDGGKVTAFDTKTWSRRAEFHRAGASFRHGVVSPDGRDLYVSDMGQNFVYRLRTEDLELVAAYRVGYNPNTIALSPDGARLFVSCRGPNNPESYLLRSLENGQAYVIDTRTGRIETILDGGNQPTGLAVSPDGKLFAFTDFLDDLVELYELAG